MLVYDISSRASFEGIKEQEWPRHIKQAVGEKAVVMLVGNKLDLAGQRTVSEEEAKSFSSSNGYLYYEVSAKDKTNVEDAFKVLMEHIVKKFQS